MSGCGQAPLLGSPTMRQKSKIEVLLKEAVASDCTASIHSWIELIVGLAGFLSVSMLSFSQKGSLE